MKRTGLVLAQQAEGWLFSLGRAESLAFVMHIDPAFALFMKEECGVDEELIKQISSLATVASLRLKNESGIVTERNCEQFLEKHDLLETKVV